MRIELCGGIASGKTTLTSALGAIFPHCDLVKENVFPEVFLNDFYLDPTYYAYETESFFLLQHMHQIKLQQRSAENLICDFSLEQDYAYGESNLRPEEVSSFQGMYQVVRTQIGFPDYIIFLECPIDILLKRIAARGRENERDVDADYLNSSLQCLKERLSKLETKIITVDSHQFDFHKRSDMDQLVSGALRPLYKALS